MSHIGFSEYFAFVVGLFFVIDYLHKEPPGLFVDRIIKGDRCSRVFKDSADRLPRLLCSRGSQAYRARLRSRLLKDRQAVMQAESARFSLETGKTIFFVGEFTDEEMVYELLGLKIFQPELASLPMDNIICGHGVGDGRTPQRWIVGGQPVPHWLKQFGLKEAFVCSCEWPNAVRYCGTYTGRTVRL